MDRTEAMMVLGLRDPFTPKALEDAYRQQLATYTSQARNSLKPQVRAHATTSCKAVMDAYHFLKNAAPPPPIPIPTRPSPAPSPPPMPTWTPIPMPASARQRSTARRSSAARGGATPYTPARPTPMPVPSMATRASWTPAPAYSPARTCGTGTLSGFDPAAIPAIIVLIVLAIAFAGSRLGCVERKPAGLDFLSSPKVSTSEGTPGSAFDLQPIPPRVQPGQLVVETPRPAPLYINNQYMGTTDRPRVFTLAPGRYAINLGGRCTFNAWIEANERFRMYCRPSFTIGRYLTENLTNPRDSSGWLPLVEERER